MKRILFVVFILTSLLLTTMVPTAFAGSDPGSVYDDISGKWFADAATKYGYPEIFSDGSGKFSPDREITRIEFVKLLHKALGISVNYLAAPDVQDHFDDMENKDAGANELIDLVTTGIVEAGGSFHPDAPLDREVMIHWIMSALQYETHGNYFMPMIMPAPFSDDAEIQDAYRSEVYSAVVLKLVKGRGNDMLFPKAGATRAEAVTIVSNFMALLDSYQSVVQVTASALPGKDASLTMSLTIHNGTDETVAIHHTSGQKYDFQLFDAEGDPLYTWSADKMFMQLVSETEIEPGEEVVFSETLDSETYGAMKQAVSMRAYLIGTSDDFIIDTDGYVAEIVK